MPGFENFVARHGEVAAQAIIENLERFEGVRLSQTQNLKERWQRLMDDPDQKNMLLKK